MASTVPSRYRARPGRGAPQGPSFPQTANQPPPNVAEITESQPQTGAPASASVPILRPEALSLPIAQTTSSKAPSRYQTAVRVSSRESLAARPSIASVVQGRPQVVPQSAESLDVQMRTAPVLKLQTPSVGPDAGWITFPVRMPHEMVVRRLEDTSTVSILLSALVNDYGFELAAADPQCTSTHITSTSEIVLWEVVGPVMRPIRSNEVIRDIMATWDNKKASFFQVGFAKSRDEVQSLASLTPRRDILRSPPTMRNLIVRFCTLQQLEKGEKWSRGVLNVDKDTVSIVARHSTTNAILFSKTMPIANTDVYSLVTSGPSAATKHSPGDYTIALRSQLPAQFFTDSRDRAVCLSLSSLPDFSLMRNIVFTLRTRAIEETVRSSNIANGMGSMSLDSPISPASPSSIKSNGSIVSGNVPGATEQTATTVAQIVVQEPSTRGQNILKPRYRAIGRTTQH